ncbi:MAG: sugar phosphate isomerase/epimerase [Opitutales bacterium]|nr:sugar phosphate isomerase/epimerase [Opitutales bacterium]
MKASDFGVQSYCFRNFKENQTVAQKVREIGLDKIEICAVHADFNNPDGFEEIIKIYENEGVKIISTGVQMYQGDDREEAWFACAAAAGCKHVSAHLGIGTYTRAIGRLRKWSRQYGINVGIHCHGGYMFGGSPDVLKHLIDLGAPEVGLNIDTAWCMQIGPAKGNPVKWVEMFGDSVYGVHYKDFTFGPNGQWEDVIVGTGTLDLPAFVNALEAVNFDGMAVIEYEADVENPVPALKRCVDSMRSAI